MRGGGEGARRGGDTHVRHGAEVREGEPHAARPVRRRHRVPRDAGPRALVHCNRPRTTLFYLSLTHHRHYHFNRFWNIHGIKIGAVGCFHKRLSEGFRMNVKFLWRSVVKGKDFVLKRWKKYFLSLFEGAPTSALNGIDEYESIKHE